jgi:RimJ/RimL family protein N-acetyltransferase
VATDQGSDRRAERAPASPEKPAAELTVERVTHQDIPAICSLYKKVWEAENGLPSELAKAWQPGPLEFTSWMEGVTYFVARRAGHMVGVIGCEIRHGACRLVHLGVDPEARRRGSGSALLTAAIDWGRRSGAATVWADPLARFQAAGALFLKLGFKESGALHRHDWGEDVRFFEKLL